MNAPDAEPFCRELGSSTVYVLWALGLLGLIASSALAAARSSVSEARLELASVQASAAAEAGLRLAAEIWRSDPRSLAGQQVQCRYSDFLLTLEAVPVGGLIDLNAASHEDLEKLFIATGASTENADAAASAIVSRRQISDQYEDGGQSFVSVAELAYIKEMRPSIIDASRAFLTVDSYTARTDFRVSPAGLREALGLEADLDPPANSELRSMGHGMLIVTSTAVAPGMPSTSYRALLSETSSKGHRRLLSFEPRSSTLDSFIGTGENCMDLVGTAER